MFKLFIVLIIVLIVIVFVDSKFKEEFITLNGLNPLKSFPSQDTINSRFSFNLLPFYDSSYWDLQERLKDIPCEDDIMFGNRKIRRTLKGYEPDSSYLSVNSDRLDMQDDLLIDKNRTMLMDSDQVDPYQPYNYDFSVNV